MGRRGVRVCSVHWKGEGFLMFTKSLLPLLAGGWLKMEHSRGQGEAAKTLTSLAPMLTFEKNKIKIKDTALAAWPLSPAHTYTHTHFLHVSLNC